MARLTLNPPFPSLCPGAFATFTAACMAADSAPQQQGTGRQATMWITLTGVCAGLVLVLIFGVVGLSTSIVALVQGVRRR